MKLKFSIRYRTAWGESLHINMAYHSSDGTVKRYNLLMQTEERLHWSRVNIPFLILFINIKLRMVMVKF